MLDRQYWEQYLNCPYEANNTTFFQIARKQRIYKNLQSNIVFNDHFRQALANKDRLDIVFRSNSGKK